MLKGVFMNGSLKSTVTTAAASGADILCETPASCRNKYYRGKLLTDRDFSDEQQYHRDKLRLHTRLLHGWGVVCGLAVKPHPHCPQLRLVIEEGLAIDCCGHEIRVLKDAYVDLPQKAEGSKEAAAAETSYGGEKRHGAEDRYGGEERYGGEKRHRGEDRYGGEEPHGVEEQHGGEDPYGVEDPYGAEKRPRGEERYGGQESDEGKEPYEGGEPSEPCEPELEPKKLYLCISYTECDTEYSPAPFDDCGCVTGGGLRANRVCEGFRLELFDEKPDFWDEAVGRRCEAEDCCELYGHGCEPCRNSREPCCVPLAIIVDFVPGEKICHEQIRVRGHRRQLASTETLDNVLRCLLDKLPGHELTQIDRISWGHGRHYLCRDFIPEFCERHERHDGFHISFTRKVRSHTINPRTFLAYVVFEPDDRVLQRHVEFVPVQIHKDERETDWCRLVINRHYALQRLDGRSFDLFITLKCDVVIDVHDLAVDGNFIGAKTPTGDGVQGGTFETWIHVGPRHVEQE
jgi:hypothetical protein